jgi:hypothetical protein
VGSHNVRVRQADNKSISFVTLALARPPSRSFAKAGARARLFVACAVLSADFLSVVATVSVALRFAGDTPAATDSVALKFAGDPPSPGFGVASTPAATDLAKRAFNRWKKFKAS